jgi:hypothetical protein
LSELGGDGIGRHAVVAFLEGLEARDHVVDLIVHLQEGI